MDVFAIRNQENFVHNQQTAAAAKPLNQGVRGLAPKTPGNNGFKVNNNGNSTIRNRNRDDENAVPLGKTAKPTKTAFITPLAPRERAPLGAKTTNVKAKAFQTPAPLGVGNGFQKTQQRSASARKAKLKIHKPETVPVEAPLQLDDDDEEPEIEYCPPKITPLSDFDDEGPDPYNLKNLDPNILRASIFAEWPEMRELRLATAETEEQMQQRWKDHDDAMELKVTEAANKMFGLGNYRQTEGRVTSKPSAKGTTKPASTIDDKSAAQALAQKPQPRFAQPTAATVAKGNTASAALANKTSSRSPALAQKTLGYAAGRKVSSSLKQNIQHASKQQKANKSLIGPKLESTPHTEEPDFAYEDGLPAPSWLSVYDGELADEEADLFGDAQKSFFESDDWMNAVVDPNFQLRLEDVIKA